MGNRGMLPKFRPALLGGREAPARPIIRPVRPTAPPPPPSPPRRIASGTRPSAISLAAPVPLESIDLQDATTANNDTDASTISRDRDEAPTRPHRSSVDIGELAETFDDEETRARDSIAPDSDYDTTRTPEPMPSTQSMRSFDEPPFETVRELSDTDDHETQLADRPPASAARTETQDPTLLRQSGRHRSAAYRDEAPSFERHSEAPLTYQSAAPPPFDEVEVEPRTSHLGPDAHQATPRLEPSFETSYESARRSDGYAPPEDLFPHPTGGFGFDSHDGIPRTRDDASLLDPALQASQASPNHLPPVALATQESAPRGLGYQPTFLSAPDVPHDLARAANFPRTAKLDLPFVARPQQVQVTAPIYPPVRGSGGEVAAQPMVPFRQAPLPVPSQRAHAARPGGLGAKIAKAAWFVFGAAFGIVFMFFAMGALSRFGSREAAPLTAKPSATTTATAVATTQAPPPATTTAAAVATPAAGATDAPPPSAPPPVLAATAAAAPKAAPVVAAPRVHTHTPARRPATRPSQTAPDEDGVSAMPHPMPAREPKEKMPDISSVGDLLNAGLAP